MFSECFLYWNQGVIHCTCGHLLVESESRRKFLKIRLDVLSFPHYVIKKERPHGAWHGKTEAQKEYYVAHNARKRCLKRNYEGIHDRFLRDPVYCDSQLKRSSASKWINWHRKSTPTVFTEKTSKDIKKLVSHNKQIGQECTDATSIRLQSRSHNHEPPPPRIRRRTCRTYSFSTVSKVAPFFLKFFMVELGNVQKLVELMRIIHF